MEDEYDAFAKRVAETGIFMDSGSGPHVHEFIQVYAGRAPTDKEKLRIEVETVEEEKLWR